MIKEEPSGGTAFLLVAFLPAGVYMLIIINNKNNNIKAIIVTVGGDVIAQEITPAL